MSLEKFNKIKKHLDVKQAMEALINKDYKKAIDLYSSAMVLDPNDWKIYINRCNCYEKLNHLEEALKDAETAIALNPQQMSGHFRRGCVLLSLKQFRSAEISLRKALTLDPNDENSLAKLKETHEYYLKEFGFKTQEIEKLVTIYKSCVQISDALISGEIIKALSDSKTLELPRSMTQDMEQSIEQPMNSLNISGPLLSDFDTSMVDGSDEGIRRPKSNPFRKSITTTIEKRVISSPETLNPTPVLETSQPRMVKTRPQIFRSVKT